MQAWSHTPAFVIGRRMDVLAANPLAATLHGGLARGHNIVRMVFLDPAARELYPDWDDVALDTVAVLRASVGPDLDDPRLTELVGELSLKSVEFRRLWARADVREKKHGVKRYAHPLVGALTLRYESFAVGGSAGQMLVVYHAEPGSATERALALLTSMAAEEPAPRSESAEAST
jgi:MmyB-like transcription regulator ligand binding domain